MPSAEVPKALVSLLMDRVRARTHARVRDSHTDVVLGAARQRAEDRGVTLEAWVAGLDHKEAGPELDHLAQQLLVGETYLFRGPTFEVLRRQVLPEMVQTRKREGSRALRAASAGCATGEEAYSLAACLADAAADEPGFHVGVLGLDANPTFLERAELGRYGPWSRRGEVPDLAPWFDVDGESWQVRPEIRALVRFQRIDLARDPVPSAATGLVGMDLILCQNVLYYLEPEARARVVEGLVRALSPGGLLFFGPSDLVLTELAHTTTRRWGDVVAHQRTESTKLPAHPSTWACPLPEGTPETADDPASAPPASDPLRFEVATALADEGRVLEALTLLEALLHRQPDHAGAHTLHGLLLTDTGAPERALSAFRRALYLEPRNLLALSGAIAACRKLDRGDALARHVARLRGLVAEIGEDEPVPGWEGMTGRRLLQLARGTGGPR